MTEQRSKTIPDDQVAHIASRIKGAKWVRVQWDDAEGSNTFEFKPTTDAPPIHDPYGPIPIPPRRC